MVRYVLGTKALREIKTNFKTYLAVILIATLAVTLFTGIWANYMNLNDRLNHIYEEAHMCDGMVLLRSDDPTVLAEIQSRASYYEKRIFMTAKWNNKNIYLATFTNQSTLNLPFKISQNHLDDTMVLVDENFLNRNELAIHDSISLELPIQNLTVEMEISGIMTHPESLENSAYNPAFLYVGRIALRDAVKKKLPMLSSEAIEEMLISFENQYLLCGSDSLFAELKDLYANDTNFVYALKRSDLPSNMTIDADVRQAKQLIYIFPVIFYLVAVLIILTSISQLINRESKNIGILKALGFSKTEILFHYMSIFIMLGCIGCALGMILGPMIVPKVMGNKYNLLYQLPTISLPFFRWEYLISVGILLLIIAITSFFACYEAMNLVPAASLRGDNSVPMKVTILKRIQCMKKIPLSILMAFRNMKRKFSRTLMVLLGVLGCSALLVCGFGIEDTIYYGLDLELNELIPYDLAITYANSEAKEDILLELPEIQSIDEYAKYTINVEKSKLISSYLYLLPEESHVFKPEYHLNECILSTKIATEIGAKVGDQIHFVYQNQSYELKVSSIVDFCISQGVFIARNTIPEITFQPTAAWVKVEGDHERVKNTISTIEGIQSVITIEEMKEHAEDTIASIKVMTWTIKIFAILLAIVVIYNLALLNFKERIKDIATLKVLGFSHLEVASSLTIEILFLTFIGALIGLSLGYPLLIAVLSINENPLLSYIYHIQWGSYLWTLLITCGSSFFINMIFAFLTNRVEMVESLKSVE